MDQEDLDECAPYWGETLPDGWVDRWIAVRRGEDPRVEGSVCFRIANGVSGTALIEDEDVNRTVVGKMLDSGVRVEVFDIPEHD